jgi:hypothetical protein
VRRLPQPICGFDQRIEDASCVDFALLPRGRPAAFIVRKVIE